MTRSHRLIRILAAALAVSALVAPASIARPMEKYTPHLYAVGPVNAPGTDVSAPDQQAQAPAGQDLRSPDAADTSRPSVPAQTAPVVVSEKGGPPWPTIAVSVALACFALGGAAAAAGRIRRTGAAA